MGDCLRGQVVILAFTATVSCGGRSAIDDEGETGAEAPWGAAGQGGSFFAGAPSMAGRPTVPGTSGGTSNVSGAPGRGGQSRGGVSGRGPGGRGGVGGRDSRGGAGSGGTVGLAGSAGFGGAGAGGKGGFCGDGQVDAGETCDDGNSVGDDGCDRCTTARCLVPITHESIQAAHDDLSCETIWVSPGTYTELLELSRDVTIVGVGELGATLDGEGRGRVVDIASGRISLEKIHIQGGLASMGAGIYNRGELNLSDCSVELNVATGPDARGGGIFSSGPIQLFDSRVRQNLASGEIAGSAAVASGGGIFIADTELTLSSSNVENNLVSVLFGDVGMRRANGILRGGGIYVEGSVELIGTSTVLDNAAQTADGDVSGNVTIEGAGIYVEGSLTTAGTPAVLDNRAAGEGELVNIRGAGVYLGETSELESTGAFTVRGNVGSIATTPSSTAEGGGLYFSGAGSFVGTQLALEHNVVESSGPEGVARGGGVFLQTSSTNAESEFRVIDSSILNNMARGQALAAGGGLYVNAQHNSTVVMEMSNSTAAYNLVEAHRSLGGFAALEATAPNAALWFWSSNSTFVENIAQERDTGLAEPPVSGGGAFYGNVTGASVLFDLALSSSTVVHNLASIGGALYVSGSGNADPSVARIHNTLIYGNADPGEPECALDDAAIESYGYNLFSSVSACDGATPTGRDVIDVDPALGSLAANGGRTRTVELFATSPAVDAGDPAGCTNPAGDDLAFDQRGEPRHAPERCDIGAFELQREP